MVKLNYVINYVKLNLVKLNHGLNMFDFIILENNMSMQNSWALMCKNDTNKLYI
jgi:hypothetical protein